MRKKRSGKEENQESINEKKVGKEETYIKKEERTVRVKEGKGCER